MAIELPEVVVRAQRPPEDDVASFRQLLEAINQMTATGPEFDDIFAGLGNLVRGAKSEEAAARTAFESASKQQPQTSPLADLVARSLGQLSEGLTGRKNAPETAESTIKAEQMRLTASHVEELDRLAKAYERAAQRAARLEDSEMEVKLREKITRSREAQAEKIAVLKLLVQSRLEDRRSADAAERTAAAIRGANWRAMIGAGFDPASGAALPPAGGKSTPKETRWTTVDQLGDNLRDTVAKHTKRDAMGNPTGFDKAGLRTAIINGEVPPPEEWRTSPERYIEYLVSLKDPDNPNKLLFPAGKNGKSPFDQAILELVRRYFPDYTP